MKCDACERGDHWDCNLASWCDCDDPDDGCEPWEVGVFAVVLDARLAEKKPT